MKIILRPHFTNRLKQRQIPKNYPTKILEKPDERYFDTLKSCHIAIRKLKYKDKLRPMMVAYDIIGDEIQAITIHPENDKEVENRLKSGRWIKYEEN